MNSNPKITRKVDCLRITTELYENIMFHELIEIKAVDMASFEIGNIILCIVYNESEMKVEGRFVICEVVGIKHMTHESGVYRLKDIIVKKSGL